jgi:hypothetical protein
MVVNTWKLLDDEKDLEVPSDEKYPVGEKPRVSSGRVKVAMEPAKLCVEEEVKDRYDSDS